MDNENKYGINDAGETPAEPEKTESVPENDVEETLGSRFSNMTEEEFEAQTGSVVPSYGTDADEDTLQVDTQAVNEAVEQAEEADMASGEYHYDREQYASTFGAAENSQPSYNRPPAQENSYVPPYYQQNNGYQPPQPPYGGGYSAPAGNPVPPKKKNTGMKVFTALIAVIVVLAIALIVAIFAGDGPSDTNNDIHQESTSGVQENKPDTDNVGDIQASPGTINAGEAVSVAKIAKPFNVGILVYQNNSLYTEGSGVLVKEDDDGKYTYIVTCAHVVNHTNVALSVLLEDGTEYPADLVGMDTRTDLAVVRIEASGLPLAEIASSEGLVVGQTVYAVGNPGGSEFFGSVTNGIISAIDRPVSSSTGYEMDCIQHTSAINPGNSGGALVNGDGKLIGINSMKIASTEYEGMGFSVPSDVVVDVFNSIIENGYVAGRAKLGISYTTPSNYSQTYAMYVQMKGLPTGTIVIAGINEDSDLADKDVKVGDMIVAVNGKDMKDADMLSEMIEDMSAGDSLVLTIVRVNTENWSQTETDIRVKLVEDRGVSTNIAEEENDNSNQNPFGNGGSYEDWYDFYKDHFGY